MTTIRHATPNDAHAIASIHVQSWRETYPGIVPDEILASLSVEKREQSWREDFQEGPTSDRFNLVAEDDSKVVCGFVVGGGFRRELESEIVRPGFDLDRIKGELQAIYLLKSHHKLGIGNDLFHRALAELKRLGHQSMFVWVLEKNPTSGFYERKGGVEMARKRITIGVPMEEVGYGWNPLD
jgi:GNAT superfamily N-acetyltransferase